VRVLGRIGQRLRHRVVRRDLHLIRQPPLDAQTELDRHRGPPSGALSAGPRPCPGKTAR
jgi:hypothetical protein